MKLFAICLCLFFSLPTAFAENLCSKSKYKLLDNTIKFGTTLKSAEKTARKKFKRKSEIMSQNQLVLVVFKKPVKNVKQYAYYSIGGKVTRQIFVYDQEFMSTFGGPVETLKILLEKAVEKYGKAEDVDVNREEGKITAYWKADNGLVFRIIAQDSDSSIMMRYDCESLEEEIKKQKAKNANFGF